jgi:murein DD-endopeptidase MepM/ murein hydrolase activator NlpD
VSTGASQISGKRTTTSKRVTKARSLGPPRARDSRMDRRAPPKDPHWLFVMVPTDPSQQVERVQVAAHELRRWKLLGGGMSTLVVCLMIAVAFAWPRSRAYGSLVQENLELKQRLEAVDRKMSEVDRILLRLRLYDAQLESLGAPLGDHGPIPVEAGANAAILEAEGPPDGAQAGEDLEGVAEGDLEGGDPSWSSALRPADLPEGGGDEWMDDAVEGTPEDGGNLDEGIRPAQAWAEAIAARAETFLQVFAKTEPNLNMLMEEMESLESLERALPSLWPANGAMNSGYGWRRNPFGVRWKHHGGVDVDGNTGDPIYAAADGQVIRAGWIGGYGLGIEIAHGYGVTTLYGHCSKVNVQIGQLVRRGDTIAKIGSTGRSTGPHLHFEVRLDHHPVDPLQYLQVPPHARKKVRGRAAPPPGAEIDLDDVGAGEEGHAE